MSKSAAQKASSSLNYHDDINTSLDREHDMDATADDEGEGNDDEFEGNLEVANQVKAAVLKVSHRF